MQKLGLNQSLSQKLSPQQIQFIKLLQVPTAELDSRIEEELESNPALEEGKEEEDTVNQEEEAVSKDDNLDIDDYIHDDEFGGYKMQGDGNYNEDEKTMPIEMIDSFMDGIRNQISYLGLNEKDAVIANYLIGSIEGDGYIRRDMFAIVNDLAFSQNVECSVEEIEAVLTKIQTFDPPGIAARNLQECLTIQLDRKEQDPIIRLASKVLKNCYTEFTKKHYDKIIKKLDLEGLDELKYAIDVITKLNPKPGGFSGGMVKTQYLMPDFIIYNRNGDLDITLNSKNAPELKVSRSYSDMMDSYKKSDKKDKKLKETVTFVKQKLDAAKWFIDAIKQRQNTLLFTMDAIAKYQYDFFISGDESKLRPMILKDIAEEIKMDISTVSRVANSKAVQTEFGLYPLKYFFTEGIATTSGEDVSSREVKNTLERFIKAEDKRKPLSDEKLEKLLKEKGYKIARRTVAKYREQLNIPVARLRKEL